MTTLTKQQADCLDFITGYIAGSGGVSPTIREIADAMGMSLGWTQNTLNILTIAGRIRRLSDRARGITVVGAEALRSTPSVAAAVCMFADIDRVRGGEARA